MLSLPLGKHIHANHFDTPSICKCSAIVSSSHRTLRVVVYEFTEQPCWRKVGEQAEVYSALGVPLAGEYAALARSEWDHVPWSSEVRGL